MRPAPLISPPPRQPTAALRLWTAALFAVAAHTAAAQSVPATPAKPAEPDFTAMSLEELGSFKVPTVYGASKHEQKITEAPSAVSILTREDLQLYGHRTLGDVLRSVRGFYVTNDRAYNYTGLRGFNRPGDFGGRVLINLDGHRLNEPLYDSAFTDTDLLLDLDLVERIEIIRGPGSSLYGNNAFFTVINLVTRRGGDVQGTEVSAAAGGFDTFTGRLTYGQKFRDHGAELLVSGTWFDSAGHSTLHYPEFAAINGGRAVGRDGARAPSAYVSLSYGDFTLSGGYIDRLKDLPTAMYGTIFNDPRTRVRDVRSYGELKYARTFAGDWAVQVRASLDSYRFEDWLPIDYPPVTLNRDFAEARWGTLEAFATTTLGRRHRLTVGGEFRRDFDLDLRNFDVAPPVSYLDVERRETSFAFYAQDEITLLPRLVLNAGVRHDRFGHFGGTTNPRGALVYRPWAGGSVKLLHGRAFRAPNEYEESYLGSTAYKTNPDLRPETIQSSELVFEQGLPGGLHATASVFFNHLEGLIGQTIDPRDRLNYFANLDHVDSRGFEVELEGRWARGARGRLSYTHAHATDGQAGTTLSNSPRHLVKAAASLPLWRERLFASLELQGMSRRQTEQGREVGAFWLAHFTLGGRKLPGGFEFSASVYNLFDQRYRDPVSTDFVQDAIPQDGRSFRVKLTGKF
ncbi:MAG: TonB-dependent receptor [Verrucomicrobia bacterium]|nr:TonB-dependent receptor [Verrucomicrobiota bacterium]